jgi:hypothetical protein
MPAVVGHGFMYMGLIATGSLTNERRWPIANEWRWKSQSRRCGKN